MGLHCSGNLARPAQDHLVSRLEQLTHRTLQPLLVDCAGFLLVDRRVKRVPDSLGLAVFGFVARSTKA